MEFRTVAGLEIGGEKESAPLSGALRGLIMICVALITCAINLMPMPCSLHQRISVNAAFDLHGQVASGVETRSNDALNGDVFFCSRWRLARR